MVNQNDREMVNRLYTIFYRKLLLNALVLISTLVMVFLVFWNSFVDYLLSGEGMIITIICGCISAFLLIISIIALQPFLLDYRVVKSKKFERIIGKVIKFRKVVHGGDPDTVCYYPTFKSIVENAKEIELKADGTEIDRCYRCVFLPNTRITVCIELVDFD